MLQISRLGCCQGNMRLFTSLTTVIVDCYCGLLLHMIIYVPSPIDGVITSSKMLSYRYVASGREHETFENIFPRIF